MTYNAARQAGFPIPDAMKLAEAVKDVDKGTQSASANDANKHAMGGHLGGRKDSRQQSPDEAYEGTVDVVASGKLVEALHAIQDSYYHHYENWDGGYSLEFAISFPCY